MGKKQTGAESFAMVVFASEWPDHPEAHPVKTHSFAAFIHEKHDGELEQHVISWLPESGFINGFLQIGENYSLPRSLNWCFDRDMAVYAWHAYEIEKTLFDSALRRISELESGYYRYYFFGMGGRNINCTHALSDLDILPELGIFIQYGVNASRECLYRMRRWSWQSSNPGKYEAALALPPNKIHWLEYGYPQKKAKPTDPKQYFTNFAKDLPSDLENEAEK